MEAAHKVIAKRRLLDPQLVDPQAQGDDNQSSPSRRVEEQVLKRVRLQEIAEQLNEPVPGFSGVMSDKRKQGPKGCRVTGTYDEQIEAPHDTGIDVGEFKVFGGEVKKPADQD